MSQAQIKAVSDLKSANVHLVKEREGETIPSAPARQLLSLCNIYTPNGLPELLEFIQELNNCLIDKSELNLPL